MGRVSVSPSLLVKEPGDFWVSKDAFSGPSDERSTI